MGPIKYSNRLCQECGQAKATKALVIPKKLKWYVCDDCARAYTEAMFSEDMRVKFSTGIDGRIAEFRVKK